MRMPKPFFRKQTRTWYVQIDGKQHNLGPDKDTALKLYGNLIAGRDKITDNTPVYNVLLAFLEWDKQHRAASTHDQYQRHILSFAENIPTGLTVRELKNSHVNRWIEKEYKDDSGNYRRNAIRAIQRAFNWAAIDEQLISYSPIKGVKKPAYTPRDTIIEPEQWQQLVKALEARGDDGRAFLEYITFLRQTGCRPLEARTAEARHLDHKNRCLEFERELSKGFGADQRKEVEKRVIPLTDATFALCEKLAFKYPEGPLFRNSHGTPWKRHAIKAWCQRLDQRLYKKPSPKRVNFRLSVYSIRHTWATEALERGVDLGTVAVIMGHKDTKQLMKTYQHLEKKKPYLRRALQQANGELIPPATPHVAVPA